MNTPTPPPEEIDLDTPPAMQTTAQLHHILGKLTAFAATLIAKAERIDVQRDYAHTTPTKFRRRTRAQLAEIEARTPERMLWLSDEARAATMENWTEPKSERVKARTQREQARSSSLDFRPGRKAE